MIRKSFAVICLLALLTFGFFASVEVRETFAADSSEEVSSFEFEDDDRANDSASQNEPENVNAFAEASESESEDEDEDDYSQDSMIAPIPPSEGQWLYALYNPVKVYSKPSKNSKFSEIDFPGKWLSAPRAERDENYELWYNVSVNGRKGWVFQDGIRLRMRGANKAAANLYKRCVNARRGILSGKNRAWQQRRDGDFVTYTMRGGEFRIRRNGREVEDVYFTATGSGACKNLFGFNMIGMNADDLRQKIGSPSMRETPIDDPDLNILSYEISNANMTLEIYLRRADSASENLVERVVMYSGRVGELRF